MPDDAAAAEIPAALHDLGDLVVVLDRRGTITYANPYAVRLLGHDSAADLVGRSIGRFVHPLDRVRAAEVLTALASGEVGRRADPAVYRIAARDGTWRDVEINGVRLAGGSGAAGSLLVIGRYSGDYAMQSRTLARLTEGAPFERILEAIVGADGAGAAGAGRRRHEELTVVVAAAEGPGWLVVGSPTIAALIAVHDPELPLGDLPTSRRDDSGIPRPIPTADLPEPARSVGLDRGLSRWWTVRVADRFTGRDATLIGWTDDARLPVAVGHTLDVTARMLRLVLQWRSHASTLERAARVDGLTGVLNRRAFADLLDHEGRQRGEAGRLGVVFVDLDHFKAVNDVHGHAAGDALLVEVARRLRESVRPHDAVARLGGDEFVALCPGLESDDAARSVAERVLEALRRPVVVGGVELSVGASVGYAVAAPGSPEMADLVERADRAMYAAKSAGRGVVRSG